MRAGDPVTFALGYRPLRNNLAASPAMDDKVGLWTVMEALRLLQGPRPCRRPSTASRRCRKRSACAGRRRAPTASTRTSASRSTSATRPTRRATTRSSSGEIKLGAGPVLFRGPNINPRVFDALEAAAKRADVPCRSAACPKATGTDANVIQISREGVATGLVGIPNRYMHSPVEVVHLDDLDHAARLLAEFCAGLSGQTELTP